jgi:hypothetical protein
MREKRCLFVHGSPINVGEFAPRSPTIKQGSRGRFEVVHLDAAGTYDLVRVLPRSSPWHSIAKLLLSRGGHFVEMVADDEFAETLLKRGVYRSADEVAWFDSGEPLACLKNASNALKHNPAAQLNIGLGLHYSDGAGSGVYWCRHTYLTLPRLGARGGRAIWEVTQGPWGYYGFPASERWWQFWQTYAGVRPGGGEKWEDRDRIVSAELAEESFESVRDLVSSRTRRSRTRATTSRNLRSTRLHARCG